MLLLVLLLLLVLVLLSVLTDSASVRAIVIVTLNDFVYVNLSQVSLIASSHGQSCLSIPSVDALRELHPKVTG